MHKLFTVLAVFFIISGCINNSNDKNTAEYNIYSNNSNWLSLPDNITHNADVFYIYPTVCVSETSNKCSIDNIQMHKSAERVIKLQAAAFSKYANIFAPYYTQYDIDVFEYSNKNDLKRGDIVFYNNGENGHTEVVFTVNENGASELVGAHTDDLPPNDQISIIEWYEGGWQYVARPTGGSPAPIYNRKKWKGMIFCYNRMR